MSIEIPDDLLIKSQAMKLTALRAKLAEAQARECQLKEATQEALPMIEYFTDSVSEGVARRVRAALAASGPCEHQAENERLRKLCKRAEVVIDKLDDGSDAGENVIGLCDELRAAVEGSAR